MNARILEALLSAGANPGLAVVAKATLALLAAFAVIRLARGASAALRHLVAAAAFGVLLLLPLASLLVPTQVIQVPAPAPAAPAGAARNRAARPVTASVATVDTAAGSTARPVVADVATALYGVYLLGAAALGLSLMAGIVRLRRVHRRAEVSVAGTRLANEEARRQGQKGGIEVAVSTELAVPVTFGWANPVVLLPAETAEWDEAALGRAIRHELEHVARGDWATHVMARLAVALYWPHPFSWLLWRRLRLEAERACDDAVIRSHGQPETYAEQLVSLARRLRGRGAVPALSMATRSNLGLRVEAILDAGRRRAPRSRLATLAVGASAAACVLAIAPLRVVGAALLDPEVMEHGARPGPLDEALLKVSEVGDLAAMRSLLDKGANADAVIEGDGSPLIAAAREGHLEAIDLLIASGARVNRGVEGDGNALTNAAREGHLEAVRLLLEKGAAIDAGVPGDGNALIMAAGDGQLEVVRFLLDQGAGLETVVPGDENALIHASEGGQAEVVRLLIERGANVSARVWSSSPGSPDGEWRTPLLMARRNHHDAVVQILRAAGARE